MTESDQETPRGRNPFLLLIRILLHSVIKASVLVVVGIRGAFQPKPVRYGLAALVVLAVGLWTATGGTTQGLRLPSGQTGEVVSIPASSQLPPAPIIETYLKAQGDFSAKGMWDTISDNMKLSMQASDATLPQLQAELDSARQQGRQYRGATYIGGIPMSDGRSVYFYVLTVDTPAGSADIPYIYIVGLDGKIDSIQ